MINTVFFDIGGTILDESREFETWADWLGVPRHTLSAVFGAVIACRSLHGPFSSGSFEKAAATRRRFCTSAIGQTTMCGLPRRPE